MKILVLKNKKHKKSNNYMKNDIKNKINVHKIFKRELKDFKSFKYPIL